MELRQVYTTEDGKVFDNKKDAMDYLRRPKIEAALITLTGGNKELTSWLLENQEAVEVAFETGTIKRVTKSEKNKLKKALEAVAEANEPKFAFVADNVQAIVDSFRWPSVRRMDPEEKAAAARKSLLEASEGNEELADWVLAHKDALIEAYQAGVEKRTISPKAAQGLAEYRAKKAAEKAAAAK